MQSPQSANFPSFSVVMPCYNVAPFVGQAIRTVLDQQYDGDIQLVIVDDGSTDNTWETIQQIVTKEGAGKNILTIQHEQNKGVSVATDTGYQHATGEWIIKADSDDIQLPGRCAAYADIIKRHPDVCAIVLSCQRVTEDEKPLKKVPYCAKAYNDAKPEYILRTPEERFNSRMGIGQQPGFYDLGGTAAIRRDLYDKWGNLWPKNGAEYRFSDDVVWGMRYMLSGTVIGSKAIACLYRTRSSGNLEYRSQGLSYQNIKMEELLSAKSMMAKGEAYYQCRLACERALNTPGLSDWEPEQIHQYIDKLRRYELFFRRRSTWWHSSWFNRISWYIKHSKDLYPHHRGWCSCRLAPLWLTCFLRAMLLRWRSKR